MKKIQQRGFTLIELLVVIAVLGVMSAALVAAINPLAKINQAKDSQIKSDISAVANAMQAYYTAQGINGSPAYPTSVTALVTANELKAEPRTPDKDVYSVTTKSVGTVVTSVAVYATLKSNNSLVWCWKSDGSAPTSIAFGGCLAP
jgi:prepilin-type N-terminal cleavage/methylation domain-containing protein